ncbi:Uncharacterized protein SCF082_LOCUS8248 [Durusdinium trenchii]|uniref:TIL domain-containing protein n=1 Tax=Durusdinium trenchii TaxID=1381693 RepID=A0ABP0IPT8_9DINO
MTVAATRALLALLALAALDAGVWVRGLRLDEAAGQQDHLKSRQRMPPPPSFSCPGDLVFTGCTEPCAKTCEDPEPDTTAPKCHPKRCVSSPFDEPKNNQAHFCHCKAGQVRDGTTCHQDASGCPNNEQDSCPANQVMQECKTCQKTCAAPDLCTGMGILGCNKGCACEQGLFLDEKTGECVASLFDCTKDRTGGGPEQCFGELVWKKCAPNCPRTCGIKPTKCGCKPGCACKKKKHWYDPASGACFRKHRQQDMGGGDGGIADEIASVRSLNEWKAPIRDTTGELPGEGASSRTTLSSLFKEPPTARLLLNLDKVGHGKTPEQKAAFEAFKQRRKEAGKEKGTSQRSTTKAVPEHHHVIVSDLKRVAELKTEDKSNLKTQLKVLDRLSARCTGPNDAARKILSLFRYCQPDEFGFVSKENFLKKMSPQFELKPDEAERLFQIASHKNPLQEEMNYLQFREAFKRLDRSTTYEPEVHRPILKRTAPVPGSQPAHGPETEPAKEKRFSEMSRSERSEYRCRNRIQTALEHGKRKMQDHFNKRIDNGASAIPKHSKNVYVRTKLTFPEVADFLQDFDVKVDSDTVKALYRADPAEEGITFSQLCRRTADYFSQLEGQEGPPTAIRNMELKGQFLGCRAMPGGTIPGAQGSGRSEDAPVESGLRTDESRSQDRRRRRRRRRQRRERSRLPAIPATVSESLNEHPHPSKKDEVIWKAHWTEKVIDDKAHKAATSIRITDASRRMNEGNGNFLRWRNHDVDHPLESSRSGWETDRSGWETDRTLDTSRSSLTSSTSALPTPFGTDRDL